jgi:peptidoglycan hydrolase-like protein with peptidoglycan-binding domain
MTDSRLPSRFTPRDRRKRGWYSGLLICIGVALGIASTWAVMVTRDIESPRPHATHPATATAFEGDVSSTLNLMVSASWESKPAASSEAAGVVTSVDTTGVVSTQGQILYTVNLRPTVLGAGPIPAFRALGLGSKGADVTELQSFLSGLGFYHGSADGALAGGTQSAIKAWQRSLGLEPDGVVQPADIVWVPALEPPHTLDPAVVPGFQLTPGTNVLNALPASPAFWMSLSQEQSALIPQGTRVQFTVAGYKWNGLASTAVPDDKSSSMKLALASKDGTPICGNHCSAVPLAGQTTAPGTVFLTEPTHGVVIPTSAITTKQNQASVSEPDGRTLDVKVIASASGQSVVTGIRSGTTVVVGESG